jgi:hypothetical protein
LHVDGPLHNRSRPVEPPIFAMHDIAITHRYGSFGSEAFPFRV